MKNSPQLELWIESPRTGKRIVLWDSWWKELAARAPAVKRRIVHARAVGHAIVEFTVAELRAVAEVSAMIGAPRKPIIVPAGFTRLNRYPRRGWRSH